MSEIEEIRAKKMKELKQRISGNENAHATKELSDADFSATIEKNPFVVVDFWAPWCMPCKMLSPTIEALAEDYEGRVLFSKLNTDQNIGAATKFGITAIPTLLFFKNGKLIDRVTGAVPREIIEARIKKYL